MSEESEQLWDDHCVAQFAEMMREKMALSRAKGRSGWSDPSRCSVDYLRHLLYEHLDKGDPVDVANICMMLRHYDASTTRDYGNTLDMWKSRAVAAADRIEELEAKLAKAVGAARELMDAFYSSGNVTERHHRACQAGVKLEATLTELTARKSGE